MLLVADSSFHEPFGISQFRKPTLAVKIVRVAGHEYPATQATEFGMRDDCLDEPLAQAVSAILVDDENVGEVCKCCSICNYACEADLRFFVVDAKTK